MYEIEEKLDIVLAIDDWANQNDKVFLRKMESILED